MTPEQKETFQKISIHAPVKGATHIDLQLRYNKLFQSTPP